MAEGAELAFEVLNFGVEKIPSSAFDHVPGYRPPKEVRQQRKEEKRRRKQGLPHGDPYSNDDKLDPDRRYPTTQAKDPQYLYGNSANRTAEDPPQQRQQMDQNYYQPPREDYRRGYNPADYRPGDDYGGGGYDAGYARDGGYGVCGISFANSPFCAMFATSQSRVVLQRHSAT